MKLYIYSMAQQDSFVRNKLIDRSEPLIDHLIKLALYPGTTYCNGWRKEVHGFIPRVDKLKRTKTFPDKNFIFKAFQTHFDNLSVYKASVIDDMRYDESCDPTADLSDDKIYKLVEDYCMWLSIMLSNFGMVTNNEVNEKLRQLGL